MLGQELTETSLVLEDTDRFVGAAGGQPHLFGNIGSRHDAGVAGKRGDAVDLHFLSGTKGRIQIRYVHVAVFIGILVCDIIRKIVACNDVYAQLMGGFDDGERIAAPAQNHQFFHNLPHASLVFLSRFLIKLFTISFTYA